MQGITTIGLHLAKRVFQLHAIDEQGQVASTGNCSPGTARTLKV